MGFLGFGKKKSGLGARVKDPVCGAELLPQEAFGSQEREGQTYYFHGASCLQSFQRNPTRYRHHTASGEKV